MKVRMEGQMKENVLLFDDEGFVAEVNADSNYDLIRYKGVLYMKSESTVRSYFNVTVHNESELVVIATKEGNKMNQTVSAEFAKVIPLTKASENQTQNKLNIIYLLIASQLKAFGKAFERTNKQTAQWLVWAGEVIEAYYFGTDVPQEPDHTDKFNSPIPDAWRFRFEVVGYQVESLGITLGMLDADDVGRDDKFAAILVRISSVLKGLAA